MATFELTGPDGSTYQIEAPSEQAAFDAFSQMNGSSPTQAKTEDASSVSGVAKSFGVGLAKGAISLAGLPGDAVGLGRNLLGYESSGNPSFGSANIQKMIEGYTGPFYKPRGVIEQGFQTVGEFAPAAVGGPGSLAARFATRALAPALASETAGQLTKGTDAEPYARLGGALAGGVAGVSAGAKFNAMAVERAAQKAIPTADETIKTAKGQFKAAEDMNLTTTPDFATNAAAKMRADLKGFDPEAQAVVFKAADRLEGLGRAPNPLIPASPVAMNDVELIRKQLTTMKTSQDASVREAARRAIGSLQESQLNLTPAQVLSGNADEYTQLMKDAIGNYAAGKRSNTVMGKVALGDLNAATAGSGANGDNALRQAIKQLVRPVNNDIVPKASRLGFNAEEIAAMNRVARGSTGGNVARYLGKLAPTGSVSGVMSGGAGFAAAGPVGAVALPAAGYVAKMIGDLSTKKAVRALDSLVRSRSPLAAQVASQLPPQITGKLSPKTQALLDILRSTAPALPRIPVPAGG